MAEVNTTGVETPRPNSRQSCPSDTDHPSLPWYNPDVGVKVGRGCLGTTVMASPPLEQGIIGIVPSSVAACHTFTPDCMKVSRLTRLVREMPNRDRLSITSHPGRRTNNTGVSHGVGILI